jgi:hypothetical protein
MNTGQSDEPSESNNDSTGLAWPRTWKGAYIFVAASLVLWLALLIALTELFS